jgi:tetratricopeptide (TPR) repeat protein
VIHFGARHTIAAGLLALLASAGMARPAMAQTARPTPPPPPLSATRPAPAPTPMPTPPGTTRMVVVPFEVADRDPRALWLGEAAAILLSDALRAMSLPALTRAERVRAFEEANLPTSGRLSLASLVRVGHFVLASDLIIGTVRLSGEELVIEARRIRLDTGRLVEQTTDRAPLPQLFALHDRVAHKLMGTQLPAGPTPPAASGGTTSLGAFENYVKGLIAENPTTQIRFLQAALKQAPDDARTHLALWEAYSDQGDHAHALTEAQAVAPTAPLYRRARFASGRTLVELGRLDDAFQVFRSLADERPSGPLYNNLGVVQIRRAAKPESGKPTYYFTKASEMDAEEPDYFFNLGYAYWLEKDSQAAIYWLREAVRRNTADGDAHFVLGVALQASGASAEGTRELALAKQLSSKYAEWEKKPGGADQVPKGLERPSADLETMHGPTLDAALLTSAQREQRELATFHLERGRRFYEEEHDRDALLELRKAVYLTPYAAEPHVLLGKVLLRTGRAKEAVDALRIAVWSQETAQTRLVLAEALLQAEDKEGAKAEATRALALDPTLEDAKALLARIDKP